MELILSDDYFLKIDFLFPLDDQKGNIFESSAFKIGPLNIWHLLAQDSFYNSNLHNALIRNKMIVKVRFNGVLQEKTLCW